MMQKPGMMIYFSLSPAIKAMTMEERGQLLTAMLDYAQMLKEPDFFEGGLKVAWAFAKAQLDVDDEKYKAVSAKRKKAAETRWEAPDNFIGRESVENEDANACKCIEKMQTDATDANTIQYNFNTIQSNKKDIKADKPPKDAFAVFAGEDKKLLEALREFEQMRRKIKKPFANENSKERFVHELERKIPPGEIVEALYQSVDHCWQGVFPLSKKGGSDERNSDKWDSATIPGITTII